ncbi:MAG: T9SS type A sorting domain-containing protein, partial [Bacteroidia bacterium]|nr:T9SS type A sorting domain-containing protein [Bacteroidia bacterium]
NLWIGTKQGLAQCDGVQWITYHRSQSPLPSDSVYAICIEGTTIWTGTYFGLTKFDGTNWTTYNTSNSGITNERIYILSIDKTNGDLWMGNEFGITIKSGNSWHSYNQNNSNLPYSRVRAILTKDNKTFISTAMDIWEYQNGSFNSLSSRFSDLDTSAILNNNLSPFYASSLSIGPLGGVLTNYLKEFKDFECHQYNASISDIRAHTSEVNPNIQWLVGYNTLYSFNYNNYTLQSLLPKDPKIKQLDINNVKANLGNTGFMHQHNYIGGYEVPKNSSRNCMWESNLWIAGEDDFNQIHLAAIGSRYNGKNDYQPGPLDTINGLIDSITSSYYDKIWKIDRLKIEEFQTMFANGSVQNGVYAVDPDILSWPAHGAGNYSRSLAPFVDVNANGIYDPLTDGDYPKIKGDQMCFWIFNDNLPHTSSGGQPLKVEIHASAYGYYCPDYNLNDSTNAINYTTFYNYKFFNRSSNDYHNTRIGLFEMTQIGGGADYKVGCDKQENYAFTYNIIGYNSTGGAGDLAYEYNPPILSTVILNGPTAEQNDFIDNNNNGITDELNEKNLMANFIHIKYDTSSTGFPDSAVHFYNYLNSKWKDGTSITYGGDGYGGTTNYPFMYDGIPTLLGWNDTTGSLYSYRTMFMSCGPFNLNSGENVEFDYAIVFTRDSIAPAVYSLNNLWQRNRQDVINVKQWFAANNFPSCIDPTDNSCYSQFTMVQDSLNSLNYYVYNNSSTGNQYSYLWNFGDGTTSTIPYPTHVYPGTGPYQLCLTVSDNSGCSSTYCDSLYAGRTAGVLTINVMPTTSTNSTPINDSNISNFILYPNPALDQISIASQDISTIQKISVYDLTGRLVKEISSIHSKEISINISDIEKGIYFLTLNDGKRSQTKKFIKQ